MDPIHHLMRVRVRKRVFADLQGIALTRTHKGDRCVTVSDLVRAALNDYLRLHQDPILVCDASREAAVVPAR
jgi:hypothetical protein